MPKADLTTQSGIKIQIEGTALEIKELIAHLEGKEAEDPKIKSQTPTKRTKTKKTTATGVILSLRDTKYFNQPKNLEEITRTLAEQGMIYPATTLSPLLLKLVRRRFLGRIQKDKRWYYVKR